jgi:hypothetical protein
MVSKEFNEPLAFDQLLGELKLLRSDLAWVREKLNSQGDNVTNLYDRVREVETAVARIEARQKPAVSWPAIATVVVSLTVAIIAIADRLYVNQ